MEEQGPMAEDNQGSYRRWVGRGLSEKGTTATRRSAVGVGTQPWRAPEDHVRNHPDVLWQCFVEH